MRSVRAAVLVGGLLVGVAGVARADMVTVPITVGGGWQWFWWHEAPGAWNDDWISLPHKYVAFTYTSPDWTSLQVTDVHVAGDRFEVYDTDWLNPIGTTSASASVPWEYTSDIDDAYASSRWSSGAFLLAPGDHAIRIKTIETAPLSEPGSAANAAGSGALRVDSVPAPVPAPAGVTLGVIGLGLSGWLLRRHTV
jgi:hypothetical protein